MSCCHCEIQRKHHRRVTELDAIAIQSAPLWRAFDVVKINDHLVERYVLVWYG